MGRLRRVQLQHPSAQVDGQTIADDDIRRQHLGSDHRLRPEQSRHVVQIGGRPRLQRARQGAMAHDLGPRLGKYGAAHCVIGMHVRHDQMADRPVGHPPDGGVKLLALGARHAAVDDRDRGIADDRRQIGDPAVGRILQLHRIALKQQDARRDLPQRQGGQIRCRDTGRAAGSQPLASGQPRLADSPRLRGAFLPRRGIALRQQDRPAAPGRTGKAGGQDQVKHCRIFPLMVVVSIISARIATLVWLFGAQTALT